MSGDPWRTQGEYREEQKRLRRLYVIAYASVIIASLGAAGQWYAAVFASGVLRTRAMNPPTWLDERGRPHAKQPCPTCGREIPVITLPTDLLKWYGWHPWQLWSTVEWCGHQVEGIPVPDVDGRWRLIVVEGEAT